MNPKSWLIEIDVSCNASVNFLTRQKPHTRFASCHHVTCSPDNAIRKKTCSATRLKCRTCHENCMSSSENDAEILCLSRRTTFNTLWTNEPCWNVTMCPACHTKRCYATFETSKSYNLAALARGTAIAPSSRTVADGCRQFWLVATVADRCRRLRTKSSVERTPLHP